MTTCKEAECGKSVFARDLCSTHYFRARRARMASMPCSVSACTGFVYARSVCMSHYTDKRRAAEALDLLGATAQTGGLERPISVRLPDAAHQELAQRAAAAGVMPSRIARALLLELLGKA